MEQQQVYDVQRVQQPEFDPVFSVDRRIIEDLCEIDRTFASNVPYFGTVQVGMLPWMRSVVSEWMKEVCEEQKAELEVYTQAMQFFDRFLTVKPLPRNQLQLLGAASILLASKLKETVPFTVEKLVMYTDYSVTKNQVLQMEIILSQVLDFDIGGSTPFDFLLPLLDYLRAEKLLTYQLANRVRQECQKLVCNFVADEAYLRYTAGPVAASCIAVVVAHSLRLSPVCATQILDSLTSVLGAQSTRIRACCALVECFYLKSTNSSCSSGDKHLCDHASSTSFQSGDEQRSSTPILCTETPDPCTPTDVREIC